eukprot:TRINITY_DN10171_c0_g1_i2.p1 TRINITY_DN10171_c0_g1~~TRINITY_DN10171_c0_g1_i2.p1  ORF type:complete len:153 (+),score=17.42 TRINITY_DN10171_c0_g1_i2:123-581(+)
MMMSVIRLFFKENNLTYRDVADPTLLARNPERFLAWSGINIQKYRSHQPHPGYTILKRWSETYFVDPDAKKELNEMIATSPLRTESDAQKRLQKTTAQTSKNDSQLENFFVFTTNVDGYFLRSGFPPQTVCQTHGTYERWQCSGLRLSLIHI